MSQRCYSCGRESPLGQPLQHYYGCDVDTFKSPNQDAGGLPSLLQQARREFRGSDAAGDVLDWLELRAAGSQDSPAAVAALAEVNELIEAAQEMSAYFHVRSEVDCVVRLRAALSRLTQGATR